VYLDSSDFSRLSQEPLPASLLLVRQRLLDYSKNSRARFVFSGIVLSEMAPVESHFTGSAVRRTKMLTALCGRNALPSFDRLVDRELHALSRQKADQSDPISPDGTWFPDLGQIATPAQAIDAAKILAEASEKHGLNREQRRLLKSKALRYGRLRSTAYKELGSMDLSKLLQLYPMRPQDARVIEKYIFGKATASEADRAFLESLRDPAWMMQWFSLHHEKLGPVVSWVREPAQKMLAEAGTIIARFSDLANAKDEQQRALAEQVTRPHEWQRSQDQMLFEVVKKLAVDNGLDLSINLSASDVDHFCPGISVWIRSTHTSLRTALAEPGRAPKASDFVDSLHGMYAPYVAVFRTDKYMAPIIKNLTTRFNTSVCRLVDLPTVLSAKARSTP
jgi:hypothetical protein